MRESYREELDDIRTCLVEMANSVGSQLSGGTSVGLPGRPTPSGR